MASSLDPSSLVAFEDAAAGHDGILSDSTGDLFIKPCTPAEIAFYESSLASHPSFAALMPTFMGTLRLGSPDQTLAAQASTSGVTPGTAASLPLSDPGLWRGKKLDTQTAIVLENVASGFSRPNIMDLKLGARLWDEDAPPEKRARLDKIAAETTSSSLGFRVAGMRVWQGARGECVDEKASEDTVSQTAEGGQAKDAKGEGGDDGYKVYDKMYGRKFTADNVKEAFWEYLRSSRTGVDERLAIGLIKCFRLAKRFHDDVSAIEECLEQQESRMISASVLFVYEGDPTTRNEAWAVAEESPRFQPGAQAEVDSEVNSARQGETDNDGSLDEDDDDDDDDDASPKLSVTKMIDFAHAKWTPGLGPDENVLQGVRSIRKILLEIFIALFKQWKEQL
ncbi:hypothetical protein B0A49_07009 [Cryomyces minteri]|uniref:Kinase n=1 Tax=Cryomyces minteri TaxID=331657 RepID=A0A4U0WJE3_9PEZI|nr:hypothetical protein B0A49_07009 [Cryomyces minteri]